MGGPNIRDSIDGTKDFLKNDQTELDVYIPNAGEIPFYNLITAIIDNGINFKKNGAIEGCGFNYQKNFHFKELTTNYLNGKVIEIPSPYLNGNLDKFLDRYNFPIFETNRGCHLRKS